VRFDAETLYGLLPAIHRVRDAEQGGPLRALLGVLADELATMEENVEQLYDDQFIETCADWVVPYIGDLIGYRHGHVTGMPAGSARAEVAHTIALRRRKGTAAALEQIARDTTGWPARVVEFFQTLATTAHMNHVRPGHHYAPDLRAWEPLSHIGTAFDRASRTVDVRRVASGRGRHNIPNVGVFLWPVIVRPATRSRAIKVDDRRWRVSPLGHDAPLYTRAEAEDRIGHLADTINVPMLLSRRVLHRDIAERRGDYYGAGRSVAVYVNGNDTPLPASAVSGCDLSDSAGTWAHLPDELVAIDPVLGRIALPAAPAEPISEVEVDYHDGFSAEVGGGEYERAASFVSDPEAPLIRVPDEQATIQGALDALAGHGVVVVTDNDRYEETLTVHVRAGGRVELRSANERRASLVLAGPVTVTGEIDSEFVMNGLLVSGDAIVVPAGPGDGLARLTLSHLTLVPGRTLAPNGAPTQPGLPSVIVERPGVRVTLLRCLIGPLLSDAGVDVMADDSVIDATGKVEVAFAAPNQMDAGGSLTMGGCTVIGKVHARVMPLVSNSVLLADLTPGDAWKAPVRAAEKQTGCVRFSWLPVKSRVPRRYRCQPQPSGAPAPRMMSLRYGTAVYARLSKASHPAILRGADDESEMGVFHHVRASLRAANLRLRLDEYLRAGLEAGVLFEIQTRTR
jgi:hypothetical protein